MFEFFPGHYRWSYNTWAALAAGGEFGDLGLILDGLREHVGQDEIWYETWTRLASLLETRAQDNLATGTRASAGENYFLASLYHKIAEQFVPPADPLRLKSYGRALDTFEQARSMTDHGIERVLVPYERGQSLPAYFIPAQNRAGPNPTVIFLSGLDTTKEISYLRLRDKLAKRGISCLAVDTPGVGEALRIGKLYTRYDYEVPVGAAIDYLQSRGDVDRNRIGIIGSSLGGYYVARAAAFEPRLRAVVAWGGNYDYHAVWHRRITVGGAVAAPMFQLMYITGTDTMEAAMKCVERFQVGPIGERITCPFLIVHGQDDQQVPVADAKRMFEVIASKDRTLKIFTGENGGAAHCQFDNHFPALLFVADWLAKKL